jgi:hypothetical protein
MEIVIFTLGIAWFVKVERLGENSVTNRALLAEAPVVLTDFAIHLRTALLGFGA